MQPARGSRVAGDRNRLAVPPITVNPPSRVSPQPNNRPISPFPNVRPISPMPVGNQPRPISPRVPGSYLMPQNPNILVPPYLLPPSRRLSPRPMSPRPLSPHPNQPNIHQQINIINKPNPNNVRIPALNVQKQEIESKEERK